MTKEKYKEYIKNTHDNTINMIAGFNELGNVLEILGEYINDSIDLCHDIYVDTDIDYKSYIELNEFINNNLKEVCRIIKNS